MQKKKTKEYIPGADSGLGVGADGAAGEKNMHDAEFTCALFRFIQLTCEGHNLGECFICTDFQVLKPKFLLFQFIQ